MIPPPLSFFYLKNKSKKKNTWSSVSISINFFSVRRVDPSTYLLVFHLTETHIEVFSLTLPLSLHNKQQEKTIDCERQGFVDKVCHPTTPAV